MTTLVFVVVSSAQDFGLRWNVDGECGLGGGLCL